MGSRGSKPSAPAVNAAPTSIGSRRNKHKKFLVPFFRSMSCGTSSSRKIDNFLHESSIMSGDHPASLMIPKESTACSVNPGGLGLQRSRDAHPREDSPESGTVNVSAVSYQSLSSSEELRETSLLPVHRHGNKAATISSSQRVLSTDASINEHLTIPNGSCVDISSNQLTLGGDEINDGLHMGSISGDISECVSEQENPVNLTDLGRGLVPFQSGCSTEISRSSLEDTRSAQDTDDVLANQVEESVLDDVQTLDASSGISRGDLSAREARRNNGRRLWDALTRASSRRRSEDNHNFANEGGSLSRRSSVGEERRLRARPQVWALQQFNDIMEESSGPSRRCASGRHPSGHCACEAFVMTEDWSTRASISRIVMLAEALFEVLDEIHRQSVTLSSSTSLPLVSSPAPESVVESFAVRIYKKHDTSLLCQSAECYICLVDYEEGDHIRILPCCHEFHMSCVDKWLKETHRVCPLCRHNVCKETGRN